MSLLKLFTTALIGGILITGAGIESNTPTTADTRNQAIVSTNDVEARETRISLAVSCTAYGAWTANVTMIDGIPNSSYAVNRNRLSYTTDSGMGGELGTVFMGTLNTNGNGLGTFSFSGTGPIGVKTVSVGVNVSGLTAEASDAC